MQGCKFSSNAWGYYHVRESLTTKSIAARICGLGFDGFDLLCGLDAVIIASPTWMHVSQAVQAADAGKHVLCEKPMARHIAECGQIIDACERGGVTLMVGLMKRFNPAFVTAKEMIESGELGEVFEVRSLLVHTGASIFC